MSWSRVGRPTDSNCSCESCGSSRRSLRIFLNPSMRTSSFDGFAAGMVTAMICFNSLSSSSFVALRPLGPGRPAPSELPHAARSWIPAPDTWRKAEGSSVGNRPSRYFGIDLSLEPWPGIGPFLFARWSFWLIPRRFRGWLLKLRHRPEGRKVCFLNLRSRGS